MLLLAAGLVILLAACGRDSVAPESTPSAMSTDPRYTTKLARAKLKAACLRDKGFDSQVDGSGITTNVPTEQEEAFARAEDACWEVAIARYPVPPQPSEEVMWQLYLESAVCLEGLGYEIPDPPTREAWMDAFPERVIWHPHGYVPNVGQDEWTRIESLCAQPGTG